MAGYIGSSAAVSTSGVERKKTFAVTTTTTSLTGVSYTRGFVHVFHNGIRLVDGTDYTATNGTSVTLVNAAESGDEVVVVSYATFSPADTYTKAESDAEFLNDPASVITVAGSNVGLGTSSPLGKVTVANAAGANAPTTVTAANTYLQLGSDEYGASNNGKFMIGFGYTDGTNTNSPAYIGYEEASTSGDTYGDLTFYTRSVTTDTAPTERMRITSSGSVGIGTSSPSSKLAVYGNTAAAVEQILSVVNEGAGTGTGARIWLSGSNAGTRGAYIEAVTRSTGNNHDLIFATNGAGAAPSEAMRIDSAGRILANGTSTNAASDATGSQFTYDGSANYLAVKRENTSPAAAVAYFNRTGGYTGDVISLRQNGSTVGSIGHNGLGQIYLVSGAGAGFAAAGPNSAIIPTNGNGDAADNTKDAGALSIRFDDVYATNGTIQTSDANEKQQIAALTDAEMTAAKAISQLFKTFKWNDSVAEKGADAARTHSGVIAQEVEQAMADAGLDAGDYAFFISATWWETQTGVPAVEAVAEVLDEDGNVITEAVEAKEAYTRTDTYDTLEEAPEGATERDRKGIRYPQLLSFVGAATEQRLASIETRLTALEVTP